MEHEQVHCHDEAVHHQLPIAVAFWIIRIVPTEECSSFTQSVMQIHCSICSIILHVTATQYTCSLKGVYHPHWLIQWSRHCSHMCIPVHSPWVPGYITVAQTIFIILTMAGLFPARPHVFAWNFQMSFHLVHKDNLCQSFKSCFSIITSVKPPPDRMVHSPPLCLGAASIRQQFFQSMSTDTQQKCNVSHKSNLKIFSSHLKNNR